MAVYCFRCDSDEIVKNGFMEGQQRYKCKKCQYNFVNKPRRGHDVPTVALAVWLRLNGLSQRRIASLIGVSPVAVMKWFKDFDLKKESDLLKHKGVLTVLEAGDIKTAIKQVLSKTGHGKLVVILEDKALTKCSCIIVRPNLARKES